MELRSFYVSKTEHKKRTEVHLKKGKQLKDSFEAMTKDEWNNICEINVFAKYPHNLILASDPIFSTIDFGPVGTLQNAGCVVFVSAYIICHFIDRRLDLRAWAEKVIEKGYRSWCFENFPEISFTSKNVNLAEVKKKLSTIEPEVLKCKTLDELYTITGPVKGIGGSMYLIDNVIYQLTKGNVFDDMTTILSKTRLSSVSEIIENLINGYMVPIRVNNRIYHDDYLRDGGHYIILIGIDDGNAYVLDSSIGFKKLAFKRLLESAVADKNLIAAWNLSCI